MNNAQDSLGEKMKIFETVIGLLNMLAPLPGKLESFRVMFNLVYRYLLFTGLFYFIFYVWTNKKFWHAKIQQRYPGKKNIFHEIKYSFITMVIFGIGIGIGID